MITRLIFRLLVFMLILTAISIFMAGLIGTRIQSVIYAYANHDYTVQMMLVDSKHNVILPVLKLSDYTRFYWLPEGNGIIYIAQMPEGLRWCRYTFTGHTRVCSNLDVISHGELLSPNGHYLVQIHENTLYVWHNPSNQVYSINLCDECTIQSHLDWLPDSQHIVLHNGQEFIQVDVITGDTQVITIQPIAFDRFDISPTKQIIAYAEDENTLTLFDLEQHEVIQSIEATVTRLLWSPDGEKLLVLDQAHSRTTLVFIDPVFSVQHNVVSITSNIALWGNDNIHILYECLSDLCTVNIETGENQLFLDIESTYVAIIWFDEAILIYNQYYSALVGIVTRHGDTFRYTPVDIKNDIIGYLRVAP